MTQKLGSIGRKALKTAVKATPLVGNIVDNIESERSGKGNVDWNGLLFSVVRIGLTLLLGKYGIDVVL